jgi:two-component system, NarL family, response regulator DevR
MNRSQPAPVPVLIVDDSPLVRAGLRSVLGDEPAVRIVGEAGTVAEALAAVERLAPAVVLLDVRLPDGTGIVACREILRRQPGTQVLMLSSLADDRVVREAIAAGARGYLLKENDGPALLSAITRAAAGQSVIDPALAGNLMRIVRQGTEPSPSDLVNALSLQEQRVLALLAQGLTNKEIGDRLGLTEKTVKNYLATVFMKLRVTRRAQAAALFVQATGGKS